MNESEKNDQWFWDHYDLAANQTIDFLAEDGIQLKGKLIADVGSGDGMLDLGIAKKGDPALLVGFDLNLTNIDHLVGVARTQGVLDEMPSNLQFRKSSSNRIPADNEYFDIVMSWSAYEHIADTTAISQEIFRILKPDGTAFIQVWPLFYSEHGSHLNEYVEGFTHLRKPIEKIEELVLANPSNPAWANVMLKEYASLNRLRLDEIHSALRGAGLAVRRAELLTHTVRLTQDLSMAYPLSDLLIAGFKLTAAKIQK